MKNSTIIWIIIVVLVVAGGIWYFASSMGAPSTNTSATTNGNTQTGSTATNPAAETTSTVIVLNTQSTTTLGTYLVSPNGMTLYESTNDQARVSNCTGSCATVWPPYTVPSAENSSLLGATPGITGAVGTITRADGTIQVTYNNMPLYFYDKDQVPGDAKGQNVGGFVVVSL